MTYYPHSLIGGTILTLELRNKHLQPQGFIEQEAFTFSTLSLLSKLLCYFFSLFFLLIYYLTLFDSLTKSGLDLLGVNWVLLSQIHYQKDG